MKNLLAAVTVLAVSTAQAATIHVDVVNCPGPGDGSVGDPYCSIQTAIDNAVDTDEIVVAEGTYLEAIDFSGKAMVRFRPFYCFLWLVQRYFFLFMESGHP